MRKRKTNLPVKRIVIIAIVLLFVFFVLASIIRFLKTADCFKVKDIVLGQALNNVDLSYLKGQNIFSINLDKESRRIGEYYPSYSKVRLIKILPNRIFVNFIKRIPVAYVKLYHNFYLDENSVLFDVPGQAEDLGLPIISGLEKKIIGPRLGKRYNIKEFFVVLNIIKEISRDKVFKDYKIKRIDVASISNVSFFMLMTFNSPSGLNKNELSLLEIKLGPDSIDDKINILAGLIKQLNSDTANVKYIDLRFKEPVIKFKDSRDVVTK